MELQKIKASAMDVGEKYFMSLYTDKDSRIEITVKSKPSCPIKTMTDSDEYVVSTDTRDYVFKRNASLPHFLVTRLNGKNVRVVFYVEVQ